MQAFRPHVAGFIEYLVEEFQQRRIDCRRIGGREFNADNRLVEPDRAANVVVYTAKYAPRMPRIAVAALLHCGT
jgi:hypothetical protein